MGVDAKGSVTVGEEGDKGREVRGVRLLCGWDGNGRPAVNNKDRWNYKMLLLVLHVLCVRTSRLLNTEKK